MCWVYFLLLSLGTLSEARHNRWKGRGYPIESCPPAPARTGVTETVHAPASTLTETIVQCITVNEPPQTVTVLKTIRESATKTVEYSYDTPVTVTETVKNGGPPDETRSLYSHLSSATYSSEATKRPGTSTRTRYVYETQPPASAKGDEYDDSSVEEYGGKVDCTGEDETYSRGGGETVDRSDYEGYQEGEGHQYDGTYHGGRDQYQDYGPRESDSYGDDDEDCDSHTYSQPYHPEKYTDYKPGKSTATSTQSDPVTEYFTVSLFPSPITATTSSSSAASATSSTKRQTEYMSFIESTTQSFSTSVPCSPTTSAWDSTSSSEPAAYSTERNSYPDDGGYSYDKRMPKVPGKRVLGSRWAN